MKTFGTGTTTYCKSVTPKRHLEEHLCTNKINLQVVWNMKMVLFREAYLSRDKCEECTSPRETGPNSRCSLKEIRSHGVNFINNSTEKNVSHFSDNCTIEKGGKQYCWVLTLGLQAALKAGLYTLNSKSLYGLFKRRTHPAGVLYRSLWFQSCDDGVVEEAPQTLSGGLFFFFLWGRNEFLSVSPSSQMQWVMQKC